MIQVAYLIVLIICLSFGVGSFLLAQDMHRRHAPQFLVSYFYYVVCYLIFGLYGIAGYSFFQYMFEILDVSPATANALIAIMLFFGAPFLITAWFMILKTGMEIGGRVISRWLVWIYFILSLFCMLLAGLIILYKVPELPGWHDIQITVIRIYLVADVMSHALFFVVVMWSGSPGNTATRTSLWKKTFAVLITGGMVLRNALMVVQGFMEVHTLIFLPVFFASIFVPALYLRWKTGQSDFIEFVVKPETDVLTRFYSRFSISKREVDVILQICEGKSNQEIADALFISLQTVKDHTHRIYQKTGVNTRMQLANMVNSYAADQ